MYINVISNPISIEVIVSSATWVIFKVFLGRISAIFQKDLLASFSLFSVCFS